MKPKARVTLLVAVLGLALLVLGCSDLEETDTGGVVLKVDFVNVPGQIGVNDQTEVTIPTIEIESIVPNVADGQSQLMDVLVDLYEVTYSRADTGTRVPQAFIFKRASTVPVSSTLTLTNFPVLGRAQMESEPLADLLFENGGIDRETNSSLIRMNVTFQIFGKTLAGDEVASTPVTETLEFVPSVAVTP